MKMFVLYLVIYILSMKIKMWGSKETLTVNVPSRDSLLFEDNHLLILVLFYIYIVI